MPDGSVISARALKMRLTLKRLMRRHGVTPTPVVVPLTAPTEHAMILEGVASSDDIDLDRYRFRPYCWGYPLWFRSGFPPLYYKHDESRSVGRIESLSYGDKGNLLIRATVTHALARRAGAFSVGARIGSYEIRDADSDRFHAVVTSAEITEISLTDRPANPYALVQRRFRASPVVETYVLLGLRMQRLVNQLQEVAAQRQGVTA